MLRRHHGPRYSIKIDAYNYEQYHKQLGLHCCDWNGNHSDAVNWCHEDEDNFLWAGNGEYQCIVNYCPECGFKSKKQHAVGIKNDVTTDL